MKKNLSGIALTIVMFVLTVAASYSQPGQIVYAKTTSSDIEKLEKEMEKALKELDNLGDLDFDNMDGLSTDNGQKPSVKASTIDTEMMIAAGDGYILGLKTDGTVLSTGLSLSGADKVSDWTNITMIACGQNHSLGLKSDGTVVTAGSNALGQGDVDDWKDIQKIAAGMDFTIGLKKNGTVVATGANDYGQVDVKEWKDMVDIATGGYVTVGLKSDGTILAIGKDCLGILDVDTWRDVIEVKASSENIIALKKDGTVYNTLPAIDTSKFENITSLVLSVGYAAGLQKDGTVVASLDTINTSSWKNIVAISGSGSHLVGLKSDGSVVAIRTNDWAVGRCNVEEWMLKVKKATTATSTSSKITVNNKKFTMEAYVINKNIYVTIRDLAYVLKDTNKKFSVTGDGIKNPIKIKSKMDYKPLGTELAKSEKKSKAMIIKPLTIYIDDKKVKYSVYEINNTIYFELKEVMKKLNIYVSGSVEKGITINTKKEYE